MKQTRQHDTGLLNIQVLGPFRVVRNHAPIALGSPIQQAVLLQLILQPGLTVTPEAVLDGVWGEAAPASGIRLLRTYLSRLRVTLGQHMIGRRTGGYYARLDPAQVDLTLFGEHVSEARELRRHGRLELSATAWSKAVELWRGPPIPGIPGPFAESQRQRLIELRRSALEECWDTKILLGRHVELLAELSTATRDHPLRENLTRLFMIASYRSGRQADAIAAFEQTRRQLARELGLRPTQTLQRLYDRIRLGDLN